ncbi:FHA domain-containing protein [Engelhardtia mirabilis]|uniref:FHA domain-containing protein FhaB n=1 Tax=Engelhardtia mirabilis TaxID=2528011 RepID=A0A518BQ32_9BACT|nr:FHA domain-containing protein FhaB [Planctomycetes bacterium Pla133]QDV03404.1 FHA domain-containing protein FhaB [Planctomycetes bacterium Pla86]
MTERFNLRFESGDRRGESVPVPRSGLLIGRRDGNDLVIADPSVSGRHALVRPDGDGLAVEDLGSTNGTLIEGKRIERGHVSPGQALRIGKVELSVADAESAAVSAAPPAAGPRSGEIDLEIDLGGDDGGPMLEDEIDLGGSAPSIPAIPVAEPLGRSMPAASLPARTAAPTGQPAGQPTARAGSPSPETFPTDASAARSVPPTSAGELHSIDESALERSRRERGSPLVTIAVGALLLGGIGVAAFLLLDPGGQADDGAGGAEPLAIADNLIVGGDLEGDDAESLLESDGAGRFLADRAYASSGQSGLGFVASGGASVRASTAPVRALAGRTLAASAAVRVTESATARVGLEISDSSGLKSPFTIWSGAPEVDVDERLEVRAAVPAGYDRARLTIAAGDGSADPSTDEDSDVGEVAVDDLAIVVSSEPAAVEIAVGDFVLGTAAPGNAELRLQHIAEILLTARIGRGESPLASSATMQLRSDGNGRVRVDASGAGKLWIEARAELIGEDGRALATTGVDGYRARSGDFDSSGVDSVLLGGGVQLTRLLFDRPVDVRASERGGRQRLEIDLAGAGGFTLQLSFQAELEGATELATRARAAGRDGRLGDVLALWGELLRDYPFEQGLVREADAARAEIIGQGLEELRAVDDEVERARFFALPGIYERCERDVRAVADRYRPSEGREASEVFERADALLTAIRAERTALETAAGSEPERQRAILGWLERHEFEKLAARVRDAVDG